MIRTKGTIFYKPQGEEFSYPFEGSPLEVEREIKSLGAAEAAFRGDCGLRCDLRDKEIPIWGISAWRAREMGWGYGAWGLHIHGNAEGGFSLTRRGRRRWDRLETRDLEREEREGDYFLP